MLTTEPITLHRSDLERYAICPRQARLLELNHYPPGAPAISGSAVHDAISRTITDYLDSGGNIAATELRDDMWIALKESRPDIQPDAIKGLRASLWPVALYLAGLPPTAILRYDGGEGQRSGQISHEAPLDGVTLSSEVDLVMATESASELEEIDWKSGWKFHTASDVAESFQFQFHAWLLLEEYPGVDSVRISVWNTRNNTRTPPVTFLREDHEQRYTRIMTALGEWRKHHNVAPSDALAWPSQNKCRICPGVLDCDACDLPEAEQSVESAMKDWSS